MKSSSVLILLVLLWKTAGAQGIAIDTGAPRFWPYKGEKIRLLLSR
jgi:hypothetical protein